MSLDMFFKPRSIAIIGASPHPLSIANRILTNLQEYGFKGPIYPVHPRHAAVKELPAFKTIVAENGEEQRVAAGPVDYNQLRWRLEDALEPEGSIESVYRVIINN